MDAPCCRWFGWGVSQRPRSRSGASRELRVELGQGLTYAPGGALLAAATTSLPETPGGERNWDYRYAWVRDSTFALWGLYSLDFDREADDFFYFVADACRDGEDLQVMYGVGGERELAESVLTHLGLAGYC
jgi:GH15 family glucan-1,4-alpha-glucosidase